MSSIYNKHKGRAFLIFLLFFVTGFSIISSLQSEVEQEMIEWPTTTGVITESTYHVSYDKDDDGDITDTDYKVDIEYKYFVDGVEYISTRISISQAKYGEVEESYQAAAAIAKYSFGSEVLVTYHPSVASYSVLEYDPDTNSITNRGIFLYFTFTTLFLTFFGYPILRKEVLFFREGRKVSELSVESLISDLPKKYHAMFGVNKSGLKGSIESFFGMDKNDIPEGVKYMVIFLAMMSGQVMLFGQDTVATGAILFRINPLLYVISTPLKYGVAVISYAFSVFVFYKSIKSQDSDSEMTPGQRFFISLLLLLVVFLGALAFTYLVAPFLIGIFCYITALFYMPIYGISYLLNAPIAGISARYFALVFFLLSNIFVILRLPHYEITRRKGQIMMFTRDPIYYRYITEPKSETRVDLNANKEDSIEIEE